jgi:hypothetical protein
MFSHLYETGLYFDLFFSDRIRMRAGYNAMWALNVAEAVEELQFDLSQAAGSGADRGNIFYHGPVLEFHFLF